MTKKKRKAWKDLPESQKSRRQRYAKLSDPVGYALEIAKQTELRLIAAQKAEKAAVEALRMEPMPLSEWGAKFDPDGSWFERQYKPKDEESDNSEADNPKAEPDKPKADPDNPGDTSGTTQESQPYKPRQPAVSELLAEVREQAEIEAKNNAEVVRQEARLYPKKPDNIEEYVIVRLANDTSTRRYMALSSWEELTPAERRQYLIERTNDDGNAFQLSARPAGKVRRTRVHRSL